MNQPSKRDSNKMFEIGNELMKMKDSTKKDLIPLHEKFPLLEDEQISVDNLIRKLPSWFYPEEKLS